MAPFPLRRARVRQLVWRIAWAAPWVAGSAYFVVEALAFILRNNPDRPAFHDWFLIDAPIFLYSAHVMISAGNIFFPFEYVHSVGAQILAALWLTLFAGPHTLLWAKLVNFLLWLTAASLVAKSVARVCGDARFAPVAFCLTTGSLLYSSYCATLQPEIWLAFITALVQFAPGARPAKRWAAVAGLAIAVGAAFRVTYLLALAPLIYHYRAPRRRGELYFFAAGFLVFALPWNLAHSLHRHLPYFYDSFREWKFQKHLNPNAHAFNYPYAAATEPHGLRFIVSYPAVYLKLLGERALYLFGLEPDVWFIESRIVTALQEIMPVEVARRWLFAGASFFFLLGAGGGKSASPHHRRTAPAILALLAALVLPHALVGTSTRFLVPMLPIIFYFVALGLHRAYAWVAARGPRMSVCNTTVLP